MRFRVQKVTICCDLPQVDVHTENSAGSCINWPTYSSGIYGVSIIDFFSKLLDTSDFPPRWYCGSWTDGHGWLHIISDLAVWAAYTSIPIALVVFARRRKDLQFHRLYLLFAAFILACGSVHLIEAIIFWAPVYRLSGVLKFVTAIVSWTTVIALVRIAPQALELPTLKSDNKRLREEAFVSDANARRLQLATSLAEVGILDVNFDTDTVVADEKAAGFYGLTPGSEVQRADLHLAVHPDDLPTLRSRIELMVASPQGNLTAEHRVTHSDGQERWLRIAMQTDISHSGDRRGLIAVLDITDSKLREERLERAKAAAEAANLARREFLANMSHEIRTPMAALMGHTDILLAHLTDPDNRQCALTIKRNGKHLLEILNDILDLSRIEAGRLELNVEKCDVAALLADVESLMHVRVKKNDVQFKVWVPDSIPKFIETDQVRLRQVLLNLVGNALKFTKKGRVEIRAVYKPEQKRLCFEVEDTGVGISPAVQSKLFEPFFQADTSTTREYGGSGLGLAISRRLTGMLGGEITVQSEVGEGSTFVVSLPTSDTDNLQMVSLIYKHTLEDATPVKMRALQGRFLIVDDRRDMRFMGQHYLEEAGAEVETAENGRVAIDRIQAAQRQEKPFALIVMDMQMPVMDGHTAVSELRSLGCMTPIVALTADAMPEDRERCLNDGCDDYMAKPLDGAALVNLIAELTQDKTLEELEKLRESRKMNMRTSQTPAPDAQEKLAVLLVEDNHDLAEVTKMLLETYDLSVEVAYSGKEALAKAAELEPAAVLLDIGLPDISGRDIARQLRSDGYEGLLIAVTGNIDETDGNEPDPDFHHRVLKPADPDVIVELLGV